MVSAVSNIKEDRERWAGDQFIAWYNQSRKTAFQYLRRGDDSPDLLYRDGSVTLGVEVTEAYYDAADRLFKNKTLRGCADAPRTWAAVEPDGALIVDIGARAERKALHDLGSGCVLLINVDATVTGATELDRLSNQVTLPERHCFQAIYLGGFFGWSSDGPPGYRVWKLFEA